MCWSVGSAWKAELCWPHPRESDTHRPELRGRLELLGCAEAQGCSRFSLNAQEVAGFPCLCHFVFVGYFSSLSPSLREGPAVACSHHLRNPSQRHSAKGPGAVSRAHARRRLLGKPCTVKFRTIAASVKVEEATLRRGRIRARVDSGLRRLPFGFSQSSFLEVPSFTGLPPARV